MDLSSGSAMHLAVQIHFAQKCDLDHHLGAERRRESGRAASKQVKKHDSFSAELRALY